MNLIKVGAAVLNQIPLYWDHNTANIIAAIQGAKREGVSILCLPEMCIPGYGCEDAFHARGMHEQSWDELAKIIPHTKDIVVTVGLPIFHSNGIFNAACLIADGKAHGLVAKQHLAGDGIHYEPRWFKPWPAGVVDEGNTPLGDMPMGDQIFDVGGIKIGFEICEDSWVAQRPGINLALHGADIILNPSASHFAFGKFEVRKRFVLEGSRAFGVTYIYSNLLGNEAGRAIYDGGVLIASGGKMVAQGPRFSFADRKLTTAVVDIDATRMSQARTASFMPQMDNEHRKESTEVAFSFPNIDPASNKSSVAAWENGVHVKEEEFTRAVALGLFDYMRKSHSKGFALSLSGGADSSACAILVAMMIRLAIREGWADAGRKLGMDIASGFTDETDQVGLWARKILTTVYQATENSGSVTRNAARVVSSAIGAEYIELDVEPLRSGFVDLIGRALGEPLSWERHDIPLQNIQARVRGPGIWMIANIKNLILLTTSNRSEAAVGYCTMDGDTCGSLAPIAGIDKAYLRSWLRWFEKVGPDGFGPMAELHVVNEQQPTAELRPALQGQTDETDLMPYDVLDAIERAIIRDKLMPVEVFRRLRAEMPQANEGNLVMWIERFCEKWSRNQWKRERIALSFHLDDENLDPRSWCRWPILSGGFGRELQRLREYVAKRRAGLYDPDKIARKSVVTVKDEAPPSIEPGTLPLRS